MAQDHPQRARCFRCISQCELPRFLPCPHPTCGLSFKSCLQCPNPHQREQAKGKRANFRRAPRLERETFQHGPNVVHFPLWRSNRHQAFVHAPEPLRAFPLHHHHIGAWPNERTIDLFASPRPGPGTFPEIDMLDLHPIGSPRCLNAAFDVERVVGRWRGPSDGRGVPTMNAPWLEAARQTLEPFVVGQHRRCNMVGLPR